MFLEATMLIFSTDESIFIAVSWHIFLEQGEHNRGFAYFNFYCCYWGNDYETSYIYLIIDTCCCTRNCCGSSRPFDIKILDNRNTEVIHLSRGLRCSTCWCPCCLQVIMRLILIKKGIFYLTNIIFFV